MRLIVLGFVIALGAVPEANGQELDWVAQKCAIYETAWNRALDDFGSDQLNYAFIAGNENFIAGGCSERVRLCPRSDQELDIANLLSLVMINAGTASTFLPFHCATSGPISGGWTGPGL